MMFRISASPVFGQKEKARGAGKKGRSRFFERPQPDARNRRDGIVPGEPDCLCLMPQRIAARP